MKYGKHLLMLPGMHVLRKASTALFARSAGFVRCEASVNTGIRWDITVPADFGSGVWGRFFIFLSVRFFLGVKSYGYGFDILLCIVAT